MNAKTAVSLDVNGRRYEIGVQPRRDLADALREGCGLAGQVHGGVAQGVSQALMEDLIMDHQTGQVLADTAIRGADLDEAKANEALKKAEEARAKAKDKQEIAVVEGELAMLAAQLAAIRKLRKR